MSKVTGVAALWDMTKATQEKENKNKTGQAFSQALFEMQNGKQKEGSEDEERVTIQRILPDGSVLVQVMQGKEIISQTKLGGGKATATPMPTAHDGDTVGITGEAINGAGNTIADRFNDTSTSIMTGSLFNSGV